MHTRRFAGALAAIAGLFCLLAPPVRPATTVVSGPAPSDHRACAIIVGLDDYSGAEGSLPNLTTSVTDAQSLAEALSAWPCYRAAGGGPGVQLLLANAGLEIGSLSVLNAIDMARSEVGEGDLILVYLSGWRQWDADSRQWRLLLPDYSPTRRGSFVTLDRIARKLSGTHANVVYLLNCPVLGPSAPLDSAAFLQGPPGANRAVLWLEGSAEQFMASDPEHGLLTKAIIPELQRDDTRSGSTFSQLAASVVKEWEGASASHPGVNIAQRDPADLAVTWHRGPAVRVYRAYAKEGAVLRANPSAQAKGLAVKPGEKLYIFENPYRHDPSWRAVLVDDDKKPWAWIQQGHLQFDPPETKRPFYALGRSEPKQPRPPEEPAVARSPQPVIMQVPGLPEVVSSPAKRKALEIAMEFCARRVPYVMGTQSMTRTDTSGFVWYCFTHGGVWPAGTERTSAHYQSKMGTPVPPGEPLQPGDRLYFDTARLGYGVIDHTGIYIGGGKMVHATPPHVKITDLSHYLKVAKAMRD